MSHDATICLGKLRFAWDRGDWGKRGGKKNLVKDVLNLVEEFIRDESKTGRSRVLLQATGTVSTPKGSLRPEQC